MVNQSSTDKVSTLTIVILTIIAIIAMLYFLRPTISDFKTTPGVETSTPTQGSPTITTPSSANPRH